ncbi:hypothetical protein AB1E18_013245 [Capra hircus]
MHVSERVPGGRAGRTRLGSPTGKTRFSRRRRRPGGNRLVAPASGRPGPQPPAQPQRSRRNAGRQLDSPRVTHSHARRASPPPPPPPPAPQATPGLRLGSRGSDCRASMGEGRPTQKREGATRARASLPRNRPRLGHRPQAAVAQLLLPPSPTPSGEALVAAVLRRPQAETGTPDGCFAGPPASPQGRQGTSEAGACSGCGPAEPGQSTASSGASSLPLLLGL